MKKIYLAVLLACSLGGSVSAQISEGGIPWSMNYKDATVVDQKVKVLNFPAPDYDNYLAQDLKDGASGAAKPYRVSALVKTDIDLNDGTWSYLQDGSKIWRVKVHIDGAKALDFYYDKFSLPKGVHLYLTNENGRQILGAYTSSNNNSFGSFSNQPVQGTTAFIELNVEANVLISDIALHIDKITAYYRGVNELQKFGVLDDTTPEAKPTDGSSPCNKNASCPQGVGYEKQNKATVRITIIGDSGAGFCTGTLLNNTGNVLNGTCKPLMLTATHCDSPTHRDDASFAQWRFDFHYQSVACDGTIANDPNQHTMVGANFRARSNNPSFPTPAHSLVADFLLLELKQPVPSSYDAYLAGWNRNTNLANDMDLDYYIGFHHPAGDFKKLVVSDAVSATATFNQNSVASTHWRIAATVGGTEPGSSGSGLFEKNGHLIGDLSGGDPPSGQCAPLGFDARYSKLSYAWENVFDQTAFPAFAGAQSRLKDWLDPANTDLRIIEATKSDCSDLEVLGINELETMLNNSISLYPNPTNTGLVKAKVNFAKPTDLNITVYSVLGTKMGQFSVEKAYSGDFAIDMSSYANGTYLINIGTSAATITKKVVLNK